MIKSHKEVGKDLVRELKEFFDVKNIKELTIEEINKYCEDYNIDQTSTFKVVTQDVLTNKITSFKFDNFKDALVQCDRLAFYEEGTDNIIFLTQDGQIIKFYDGTQWGFPKNSIYQ